jgi:hypothetical protein
MGGRLLQNPALDAASIISTEMLLSPCQRYRVIRPRIPSIRAISDE